MPAVNLIEGRGTAQQAVRVDWVWAACQSLNVQLAGRVNRLEDIALGISGPPAPEPREDTLTHDDDPPPHPAPAPPAPTASAPRAYPPTKPESKRIATPDLDHPAVKRYQEQLAQ